MLDQALDVFWRHGVNNTTTRTLEAELGITQSSIYHAFGHKEDLVDKVLDRYADRIEAEVVAPLAVDGAGAGELFSFVDDLMAWISTDGRKGCMLLNLLAERSDDRALVARASAYRDRLRLVFAKALDTFGHQQAPERSELMLATVLGINIVARGGASDAELQGFADGLRSQLRAWQATG